MYLITDYDSYLMFWDLLGLESGHRSGRVTWIGLEDGQPCLAREPYEGRSLRVLQEKED